MPAVLMLLPVVYAAHAPKIPTQILAMASTLAGNLTPVGSVVDLIGMELARRTGPDTRFGDYARVGLDMGLITLALGTARILLL